MKIIFLFISIVLLRFTSTYAQLPTSDEKIEIVRVGSDKFRVKTIGMSKFISDVASDQYSNRKMPYNVDELDMSGINGFQTSADIIKEIKRTLPANRLERLARDNDLMTLTVVFNPSGKINHIRPLS